MRFQTKTLAATAVFCMGLAATTAGAQTLRVAHVDPDDWTGSKKGAAAQIFKNIVEGESDMTVELFPAGALGNEDELVSQAQDGLTQVVLVSGAMSKVCAAASVLDIPYTFASAPLAWEVLDGEFGDALAEHCLEQTGLRTLAYGETGFRNFTNNDREIRTPEDMKGLKFRVQPIPLYLEMVKALGGEPTPIAWTELPNALSTGVVDGQENPVGVIYNNGLHKLQKHMTLDGHVYAADFLLISEDFYQGLEPAQQEVIRKAATVAGNMGRAIQQWNTAEGVTKVQQEGMAVYSPTAEELAAFAEAAQPAVVDYLRGELGDDAQWIDRLQQAVAEASN
ncbi:C4-dicarboxylate ABC transporter substrate-binding protein [Brevirhabdus pacifica]|uniref:C4-dicarboxylate ABC transporter substrate-binding protein n=1 Tax=Brevirhabdus pacifica TaxID=1267768 RepID=A0A1U7DGN2_9RHOB|nr:DctP family TRAP transporter solute-binding subunit [Brevirhabdus pacifica]APX89160.1 C4-dicarboxylate ABC transporter substrate-binding protein [Brevirhabdus pacifica]OWU76782.1 C4-dicarboxylate ABC transporter substrate-binding protein [Loktanella sp. 22II-4b]PJJ86245.1 tripartite ATP-independent transporter DctP family solute receptor [Brevirhabdus pacifica]